MISITDISNFTQKYKSADIPTYYIKNIFQL